MRKVFGNKTFRRSIISVISLYLIGLLFGSLVTTGQASTSITNGNEFQQAAQTCSQQSVELAYTPEAVYGTDGQVLSEVSAGVENAFGCAGRTVTVTVIDAGDQVATGSAKIRHDTTEYVVALDMPVSFAEGDEYEVAVTLSQ